VILLLTRIADSGCPFGENLFGGNLSGESLFGASPFGGKMCGHGILMMRDVTLQSLKDLSTQAESRREVASKSSARLADILSVRPDTRSRRLRQSRHPARQCRSGRR
jgi:hypothetical protein